MNILSLWFGWEQLKGLALNDAQCISYHFITICTMHHFFTTPKSESELYIYVVILNGLNATSYTNLQATHTHTYMRKHPPTHPSCITLIQAWYETVFCKLVTLYNMWMWDTFSLSSTLPAEKVCIFKKHVFSATTLYPFLKCPIYFFCGKTYVPSFSILGLNTVPSLTVLKENNKQNKTKTA